MVSMTLTIPTHACLRLGPQVWLVCTAARFGISWGMPYAQVAAFIASATLSERTWKQARTVPFRWCLQAAWQLA